VTVDAFSLEERVEWQALQRDVERAQLATKDPDVYELVQLALAPLDYEDEETPSPPRAPRPPSRSVVMPEYVLNAIRQHAATALPDHEVGGRLLVDASGRATRYVRLRNVATAPGRFDFRESWRVEPGTTSVVVHTHPHGSDSPTTADLRWAKRYGFRSIGIYGVERDQLGVFRLAGDVMNRVRVDIEKRFVSLTASAEPPPRFRFTLRQPNGRKPKRDSSGGGPGIFIQHETRPDA
jgi:proteasome lid subunit RPN8/RPN11